MDDTGGSSAARDAAACRLLGRDNDIMFYYSMDRDARPVLIMAAGNSAWRRRAVLCRYAGRCI